MVINMKKILVIGSLNLDIVAKVDHIPVTGETIIGEYGGQFRGGKGANQACAIAKLGGDVTMLGAVGGDDAGEYMLQGLAENGVDISKIKRIPAEPTGQAWITINSQGNNTITVLPGANSCVDIPYINSMKDVIQNSDIVVMQLEIPIETVCYSAQLAKGFGKTVVLDPAHAVNDLPDTLFADTDYIKPNESELELLTGCSVDDYKNGAELLLERGVKNIVVSLGANGVYCHCADKEPFHRDAHKVDVVDTTAAGDSFLAAFTLGLANGDTAEDSIDFAQNVASVVVTRPGAQSSIPTISEMNELFK